MAFIDDVHKFVKEMQEATTNANIPSDMRDLANAYRDRAMLLRQLVNDHIGDLPVGTPEIPEFDPIPE